MYHPQIDESFLEESSKVDDFMVLLRSIESAHKTTDVPMEPEPTIESLTIDNFMVTVRDEVPVLSNKERLAKPPKKQSNVDQFTFMRQVEMNEQERTQARLERERVAQNFRRLGNMEYRNGNFEKAVYLYSTGIENVKDSPILYINRALGHIKLGNFRRAIIDCDFVLNKLDEKNMRAWLYRGMAYKYLNDVAKFENCIKFARKNNSKQLAFIDAFLEKLNTE